MARVGVYSRLRESVCPTSIFYRRLEEKLLPRAGDLSRDPGPLQFASSPDCLAVFCALQRPTTITEPSIGLSAIVPRFLSDSLAFLSFLRLISFLLSFPCNLAFPLRCVLCVRHRFPFDAHVPFLPCTSWFLHSFRYFDWQKSYLDFWYLLIFHY